MFLAGVNWGLPSSSVEKYLFPDGQALSGAQILQFGGDWQADAIANSYSEIDPLPASSSPVLLNADAQGQARIARRYLLYSSHPDEMNNFRALASMSPSQLDFDPKLYHYGGLWIYPIGVALRAADALKLVTLTTDLAFYYDHPEAFARFYVVARLISASWALLGVWAVFAITARIASGLVVPAIAALAYIAMPVVINGAHTAKPHGPAAVLMLCAVLAAARFVDSGRWRWAVATGALCGAAAAMVLWGFVALVIPLTMVLLRRAAWVRRITTAAAAGCVALAVFFLTNPYIAVHLLGDRTPLQSNVTDAFWFHFPHSVSQMLDTAALVAQAASPPLAIVSVASIILIGIGALRRRPANPTGVLIAVPAIVLAAQFLWLLGGGAEPDQGRFVAFPGVALAIAAALGIGKLARTNRGQLAAGAALVVATALYGVPYVAGFVDDAATGGARLRLADQLASRERQLAVAKSSAADPKPVLGTYGQPAPYDVPPFDLTGWRLLLLPARSTDPAGVADVAIAVNEDYGLQPGETPLSWADVRFVVKRFK